MKKIISLFFGLFFFFLASPVHAVFPDTVDHINNTAIEYLQQFNVVTGYADGLFKPDKIISRAEVLKIIIEGLGITPNLPYYNNCFSDVKKEWFASYICYSKSKGWVSGYSDGSFKPNNTVTKMEALKMLIQARGYNLPASVTEKPFDNVEIDTWYAPYLKIAKNMNLIEEKGIEYPIDEPVTRASISEKVYRAMVIDRNGFAQFPEFEDSIILAE